MSAVLVLRRFLSARPLIGNCAALCIMRFERLRLAKFSDDTGIKEDTTTPTHKHEPALHPIAAIATQARLRTKTYTPIQIQDSDLEESYSKGGGRGMRA